MGGMTMDVGRGRDEDEDSRMPWGLVKSWLVGGGGGGGGAWRRGGAGMVYDGWGGFGRTGVREEARSVVAVLAVMGLDEEMELEECLVGLLEERDISAGLERERRRVKRFCDSELRCW